MNKTKWLKINLKPLAPYFFGDERTFGADRSNYLVKSRYYPQQTALLGVIRHQLLVQNGLLKSYFGTEKIADERAATALIGNQSFRQEEQQTFGAIEQLSPLYIETKEQELLAEIPLDFNWHFEMQPGQNAINGKEKLGLLYQYNKEGKKEPYSYKRGLKYGLVDQEGKPYCHSFVFQTHERVGIKKNYDGNTEEGAFYKQTSYSLRNGASFCFYLKLKDAEDILLESAWVSMGGENSSFQMRVEKVDEPQVFRHKTCINDASIVKLILLSDAYADPAINQLSVLNLIDARTFRYLKSNVRRTSQYYNVSDPKYSGNTATLEKSALQYLLKRGSVLFVEKEDLEQVKGYLHFPAFEKIGYNHYQVVE